MRVVKGKGPRDWTLGKVRVKWTLGSTYVLVEDVGCTARSELLVGKVATLTVSLGECNLGVRAAHPRVDAFHDEFSWESSLRIADLILLAREIGFGVEVAACLLDVKNVWLFSQVYATFVASQVRWSK